MANIKILRNDQTDINSNDIWRFAFHSDYKTLKIHQSGSTTLTIPTGGRNGSVDVVHGLGYEPNFFVDILYNGKLWNTYGATPCTDGDEIATSSGHDSAYGYASVDTNKLHIEVETLWDTVTNNTDFIVYYSIQLDQE